MIRYVKRQPSNFKRESETSNVKRDACSVMRDRLRITLHAPRIHGGQVIKEDKGWRHRAAWLIIIIGGFGLRLYRLGAQSLWYDETVSAHLASKSIPALLAHTAGDIHPPGYYLLLHAWTRLAGDSEFALAFFSLVFGVLLIPLSYALARRLFLPFDKHGLGQAVALWSVLLLATSPYNLWYSQEVRMYTLGAALGLVTLWFAIKYQTPNTKYQIPNIKYQIPNIYIMGYILAATAGLYVLYYFGFLLVTLNLVIIGHLAMNRRFAALRTWLLAQVAVLVFYLPWLPIAWRQATAPPVPPWRGLIPLHRVALEAWTALSLGQSVQSRQVWPILLLVGVLFILGLADGKWQISLACRPGQANIKYQSPKPQAPILLLAYTFGPLVFIYLVSLITPLYHVRYLFTYAPPFYIVLGSGLAWLTRRARPLAAVAALALLAGSAFSIRELHTNPRYAADDFRAAVSFIAERWRPGDAILINAGYAYTGFLYYYDGPIGGRVRLTDYQPADDPAFSASDRPLLLTTGVIGGDPDLGWGNPNSDFYATTQAESAAALARVTQTFPRLWMLRIYDTVADPDGFIRDWLATNTTAFEDQLFSGESFMRVQGFMSNIQPAPPEVVGVELEGDITLLGWQVAPEAAAGDSLDVTLWWEADVPPAADGQRPDTPYAVSLKLWGPEGGAHPAAQQDEWPVGSLLLTPAWPPGHVIRHPMRLWLPADLPPGQYRLDVEMYDPATVQPLPRRDSQGHVIPLGSVTVTPNQ
jgi:mannosyltransferase